MAFDVDGTLTDGTLYIGPSGESFKQFSVRDGFGLVLLRRAGIAVALITARQSTIVHERAHELRIVHVLQGVADKGAALRTLSAELDIPLEYTGFMGDDWPDIPAMQAAGFVATVPDAPPELHRLAHWTARARAGHGAARELAEHLLREQGRLETLLSQFDGRAA